MDTSFNVTGATTPSKPNLGGAQFASHAWVEPIIVISIMAASLTFNRRRDYRIFDSPRGRSSTRSLLSRDSSQESSPSGSFADVDTTTSAEVNDPLSGTTKYPAKKRSCCGLNFRTPNSSRFANNWHSRVLQKFPFLIEMFYWVMNLAFYAATKAVAQVLFSRHDDLRQRAQDHGVAILNFEQHSWMSWFFFIRELDFQAFFLNGHLTAMTFLNRIYSLVHIPGTVAFLSWYYYAAPNHATFAVVRRTMTLGNFAAFFIFSFFPTMPPRLLPKEFGFHDTVRQSKAESIWVGGNYVNQLAAMPSLHFTYAFCVGSTFLYHSGFGRRLQRNEPRKSHFTQIAFLIAGVCYPLLVLSVIVATANHYWLDAMAAMVTTTLSFFANRVWIYLLPLEDILCWILRVEKPIPTTGDRILRQQGGQYSALKEDEDEV
ncbi:hypothetical protein PV10_00445 [Exophiala mesophila]|uniref:Inositolphosphotransferase Aur1/Ipt1 domain-containing protein n=1 Tax=Exophiala mesophila TaxID=212818 RepID=A0A0D2ACD4_EXOME|nr:uncharacterized protein PV10_00445 [Exophiala mesophila]KIV96603.1 hypothetical protein PV10_00445 [Exophiala mesophila]